MNGDDIGKIKAWWNETSDSDWYKSLRTVERIDHLKENPASAFHPAVYELIHKEMLIYSKQHQSFRLNMSKFPDFLALSLTGEGINQCFPMFFPLCNR